MAIQLNIPDGIDWPVQFRQTFFDRTWGFTLRENQLLDDNRAMIDVSVDGKKQIEGRMLQIGNPIGDTVVSMPAVIYPLPEGDKVLTPTQDRVRDGIVQIFGSEK